jgi:hypothetical protein
MKIVKSSSTMLKVRIALPILLIIFAALTLTGLRAGAAGEEVFDVGTSSLPAANGTPSTVFLPISINDHPMQTIFGYEYSSIGEDHGLIQMYEAGANWVRRAGIWWPDIEPTKGVYDWTLLESFQAEFLDAQSKNIEIIIIVRGTPTWAQADPPYNKTCGRIKTSEFASFAAFLSELVTRLSYTPYNVKYWELYNEPDVDPTLVAPGNEWMGCWGEIGDQYYGGEYYADMLKVVYPAIKAANPDAQLLVGGLLMDCDPVTIHQSCGDPSTSLFLKGILENGGAPYFDGVSFHAYDYNTGPLGGYVNNKWWSAWNTSGPVGIAKAQYLKSVLSSYGASGKILLNTESALICQAGDPATCETTKAYYVVHNYVSAIKEGLEVNVWYFWYYRNAELLEPDNTPLPAYYTYQFAREKLRSATYIQEVETEPGVRTYEFSVPGGTIWVMWSLDGTDHNNLNLPGTPTAVYDSDGDPIVLIPPGKIDVGLEPVYLEWGS